MGGANLVSQRLHALTVEPGAFEQTAPGVRVFPSRSPQGSGPDRVCNQSQYRLVTHSGAAPFEEQL